MKLYFQFSFIFDFEYWNVYLLSGRGNVRHLFASSIKFCELVNHRVTASAIYAYTHM